MAGGSRITFTALYDRTATCRSIKFDKKALASMKKSLILTASLALMTLTTNAQKQAERPNPR